MRRLGPQNNWDEVSEMRLMYKYIARNNSGDHDKIKVYSRKFWTTETPSTKNLMVR